MQLNSWNRQVQRSEILLCCTLQSSAQLCPDYSRFCLLLFCMELLGRSSEEKDILPETARLAALLQGGKPPLPNGLSARQMKSLVSICDAFLRSSEILSSQAAADEDLALFYRTSASQAGIPEQVNIQLFLASKSLSLSITIEELLLNCEGGGDNLERRLAPHSPAVKSGAVVPVHMVRHRRHLWAIEPLF